MVVDSIPVAVIYISGIAPVLSKEFLDNKLFTDIHSKQICDMVKTYRWLLLYWLALTLFNIVKSIEILNL